MAFVFDSVDKNKIDGTWIAYEGSRFLVAATENIKFQKAYNRLTRPHKDLSKLSPEQMKEIMATALAEGILLDWSDVIDSNGNEVPYTKENAIYILTVDRDFRDWLTNTAADLDNFRKDTSEQAVKK